MPSIDTIKFDVEGFVGKRVFGPSFQKSLEVLMRTSMLYAVSMTLATLAFIEVLPSQCMLLCLLGLPCLIYFFLILNEQLVLLVLWYRETIILWLWNTVALGCWFALLRKSPTYGYQMLYATFFHLSVYGLPFVDALPTRSRVPFTRFTCAVAMLLTLLLAVALFFGWIRHHDQRIYILSGDDSSMNPELSNLLCGVLFNIFVVFATFVSAIYTAPHALVSAIPLLFLFFPLLIII